MWGGEGHMEEPLEQPPAWRPLSALNGSPAGGSRARPSSGEGSESPPGPLTLPVPVRAPVPDRIVSEWSGSVLTFFEMHIHIHI